VNSILAVGLFRSATSEQCRPCDGFPGTSDWAPSCGSLHISHSPFGGQVGQAVLKIAFHADFQGNFALVRSFNPRWLTTPTTQTSSRPSKQRESASTSSGCRVVKLVGEREALTTLILGLPRLAPSATQALQLRINIIVPSESRGMRSSHARTSRYWARRAQRFKQWPAQPQGTSSSGGSRHSHGSQAGQAVPKQAARTRGTSSSATLATASGGHTVLTQDEQFGGSLPSHGCNGHGGDAVDDWATSASRDRQFTNDNGGNTICSKLFSYKQTLFHRRPRVRSCTHHPGPCMRPRSQVQRRRHFGSGQL
jgi:hypothetical protein